MTALPAAPAVQPTRPRRQRPLLTGPRAATPHSPSRAQHRSPRPSRRGGPRDRAGGGRRRVRSCRGCAARDEPCRVLLMCRGESCQSTGSAPPSPTLLPRVTCELSGALEQAGSPASRAPRDSRAVTLRGAPGLALLLYAGAEAPLRPCASRRPRGVRSRTEFQHRMTRARLFFFFSPRKSGLGEENAPQGWSCLR